MLDGPTADLGAVDFILTLAEHFAGGKTVGSWRYAAQPFAQQCLDFGRPARGMIASGNAGRPSGLPMIRAGLEVIAVKFVEAAPREAERLNGSLGFEFAGAETGQHVTD